MVAATFAGSCSTPGSMSGKRSSRKGVRIPPATTALTLMPCGRSSACSACDRPSRPHLLAWYALAFGQARVDGVEARLRVDEVVGMGVDVREDQAAPFARRRLDRHEADPMDEAPEGVGAELE